VVQKQQQPADIGAAAAADVVVSPAAAPEHSRVYFNDLVYFRLGGDAAVSGMGVWVHQPKRSGELWPCARSGHAAAAGEMVAAAVARVMQCARHWARLRLMRCLSQLEAVCSCSVAGSKAAAVVACFSSRTFTFWNPPR
jgi:hypothetical protein